MIIVQGNLPCLFDLDGLDAIRRWIRPRITFLLAPGGRDNPPLCVPRLPLPIRLQASSELEAWEDVGFGVDDDGI